MQPRPNLVRVAHPCSMSVENREIFEYWPVFQLILIEKYSESCDK